MAYEKHLQPPCPDCRTPLLPLLVITSQGLQMWKVVFPNRDCQVTWIKPNEVKVESHA